MTWPYVPNRLYSRRTEIHAPYGGQQQGGIATPKHPVIFIFTGHGGSKVGYGDTWQADGSLRFTGEGQEGDMQMIRGNLAIRDHAQNGKDLLLFEKARSRAPVRFMGQFFCAGYEVERQPDRSGALRQAIVFHLVPASYLSVETALTQGKEFPLTELRNRALAAAKPSAMKGMATKSIYYRSAIIRQYVLARANGLCEQCDMPAPFCTSDGEPFLEAHHIRRVSDGGPDDPRHVAATCPNCHRQAHLAAGAKALNESLALKIAAKEHQFDDLLRQERMTAG
jgi:5-methylcytosine-specific restriction enzyme A